MFYYPDFVAGDITNKNTSKWQSKDCRADPYQSTPSSMFMLFPVKHFQVTMPSFVFKWAPYSFENNPETPVQKNLSMHPNVHSSTIYNSQVLETA